MIIISIMLSFMAYQSHLRTVPVSQKVYDLGKELDLETAQVLDYGIYNSPSQQQVILNSWANNFSQYAGEKSEQEKFVFVYYDESAGKFKGLEFTTTQGSCSSIGDESIGACTDITDILDVPCTGAEIITCTFGEVDYKFNRNENFYFMIRGKGGEVAQK
jgi:hypothetical protein